MGGFHRQGGRSRDFDLSDGMTGHAGANKSVRRSKWSLSTMHFLPDEDNLNLTHSGARSIPRMDVFRPGSKEGCLLRG
jgi:hypothetical protein